MTKEKPKTIKKLQEEIKRLDNKAEKNHLVDIVEMLEMSKRTKEQIFDTISYNKFKATLKQTELIEKAVGEIVDGCESHTPNYEVDNKWDFIDRKELKTKLKEVFEG